MNNFISLIRDYYVQNKFIILVYTVITLIFYFANYIFFSQSIDLPPDIIFIALYIVISPGLIIILTVSRGKVLLLNSNSRFYSHIIIHSMIVIIFNLIALRIYEVFRVSTGYWESIYIIFLFAIPFILYSVIIAFEYKLRFENIIGKIGFIVLLLFSWYVVDILFNDLSTLYVYRTITYLYLFVFPILIILFWYRKKLVD